MLGNLTQLFKKYQKILFIGVGNVLKQDDGAGVYICERINESDNIQSLVVGQSFENYIGTIQQIDPDILVIVDCVDFNKSPGEAFIIPFEELIDDTSNTHNISMKTFSLFFDMPVKVLGIQPQVVDYGEDMSSIVQQTADEIAGIINRKGE